jgi:hypothetical protein
MPYTGPDDEKLPDNVKKLAASKRARWVEIWNSAYQDCIDNGGNGGDCEASAFAQANGVMFASEQGRTYTPPKAAQENAKKVLRWREEHPDEIKGMTRVGWTRANQLASGKNLSLDTIKRMSQFARHRQNAEIAPEYKGTPWKDAGYVAWLGWGGDEGIAWAKRVLEQEEKKEAIMPGLDSLKIDVDGETVTLAQLVEAYREQAVATKKVGDRTHDRGDFLVVEDPEKVTTWHLPVKVKGTPDRTLAGAAWAALFDPEGYRGQPYDGPDKDGAKRKLRALYRAEEWEMPDGEGEADGGETPEEAAEMDVTPEVIVAVLQYLMDMVGTPEEEPGEEPMDDAQPEGETPEMPEESTEAEPTEAAEFAESAVGHAVQIVEAEGEAPKSRRDPLLLDVVLIRPGPGNPTDGHYYPRKMLERDARIFEGAKMYTSDHKQSDKSVRNEVSVVKEIVSFTNDGAPIARVAIHDGDFAEMARNRAQLGTLNTLECSILANGRARVGEIDGKEYKIVDAITEARSVDWVTRAGAGGRAHALAESDDPREEGATPEIEEDDDAAVQEGDATEDVTISEDTPAEARLSEADVAQILETSNLPDATIKLLTRATYADADELGAAIAEQHELLKAAGSGRPFGDGKPTTARQPVSLEEIEERKDKVNQKFLGTGGNNARSNTR